MFTDINPRIFSSSLTNRLVLDLPTNRKSRQRASASSMRKNHPETQTLYRDSYTFSSESGRRRCPVIVDGCAYTTSHGWESAFIEKNERFPQRGLQRRCIERDRVQRTSEDRGKIVAKASFVRFVVESAPERNPSK